MADNLGYPGTQSPGFGSGGWGAIAYIARGILNRICTTTLVRVVKVTNAGGLSPAGLINVQPLVNQVDSEGKPEPHAVIFNIPYLRMQGGANAIILDPEVGDVGYVGFGSHDLSAVIATKLQANPASFRRFDMADAVYIGGVLNGVPTQYIQFSTAGIELHSPTKIKLTAPLIEVTATTSITETAPQVTTNASTGITQSTATFALTATTSAGITSPLTTITGLATITGLTSLNGGFAALPRAGGGASTIASDLSVTAGNVSFSGTLGVTGATTLAGVTAGGKNIGATHTHTGVQTGGGTSGPPT